MATLVSRVALAARSSKGLSDVLMGARRSLTTFEVSFDKRMPLSQMVANRIFLQLCINKLEKECDVNRLFPTQDVLNQGFLRRYRPLAQARAITDNNIASKVIAEVNTAIGENGVHPMMLPLAEKVPLPLVVPSEEAFQNAFPKEQGKDRITASQEGVELSLPIIRSEEGNVSTVLDQATALKIVQGVRLERD